ncbi:MAG: 5-formyltetrahydrofolate cyclo-ligase [Alphaproteobacteria bacterium]|jgi:5-formyltetrahydrofolate cyclo-ligase|nr:5-formyltetrahydrofolate cyclo-ligase [Alphaproteobacteria bacterium]|tara:strand:- start:2088 stop:2678 length:591 start_codon:yes stop_codon:yes gene_type:complete
MSEPSIDKAELRKTSLERRIEAHATAGPLAGDLVAGQFLEAIEMAEGDAVAGYWPMRQEQDPVPLMKRLHGAGQAVALPVIEKPEKTLLFRSWEPGQVLEEAEFGTSQPAPEAAVLRPKVILVPLLAFDDRGFRLGYGGGYYDRTIAALRQSGELLAIGIAYDAQQVERVPEEEFDQRLDWVVTENAAWKSTEVFA